MKFPRLLFAILACACALFPSPARAENAIPSKFLGRWNALPRQTPDIEILPDGHIDSYYPRNRLSSHSDYKVIRYENGVLYLIVAEDIDAKTNYDYKILLIDPRPYDWALGDLIILEAKGLLNKGDWEVPPNTHWEKLKHIKCVEPWSCEQEKLMRYGYITYERPEKGAKR